MVIVGRAVAKWRNWEMELIHSDSDVMPFDLASVLTIIQVYWDKDKALF